jgi:ribosomal protein S18 acetylase RimI-like enzyme
VNEENSAVEYSIQLYQRPNAKPQNKKIVEGIFDIAKSLTSKWFTANVPDDTLRDLQFHDVFCLQRAEEILSFLVFTSRDGMMDITLMGTRLNYQRQGLGSKLLEHFFDYARGLCFENATVMTVPEDIKPAYASTIHFYEKHGFQLVKRFNELWENGALLFVKKL